MICSTACAPLLNTQHLSLAAGYTLLPEDLLGLWVLPVLDGQLCWQLVGWGSGGAHCVHQACVAGVGCCAGEDVEQSLSHLHVSSNLCWHMILEQNQHGSAKQTPTKPESMALLSSNLLQAPAGRLELQQGVEGLLGFWPYSCRAGSHYP